MKRWPIKGFTLIEVLLGLIIFAIIGLSAYNVFWMGMKVDHKANGINRSYVELKAALDLVSKDLENAFVYDLSASYPKELFFRGGPDQMAFLSVIKDEIKSVRYYLDLPDWGRVTRTIVGRHVKDLKQEIPIQFLMRQEISLPEYLSKKTQVPEGEIIVAAVKKSGLKLAYGILQKNSKDKDQLKKMIWKDSWTQNALPNAVRLEITLYDQANPRTGVIFKREIYLPRVEN